ncbi:hypothetical protein [Spirosoma agri]|uniref:Uncharacterized protein n=1 Tax=Spirosoma agri TaxID=1987381 RepID=A0A6M0II28_9BACT|nr:hypothetical protein [Spirosoma agri]NEU67926.1 hypothetical protein [Spirosoma agri]
MFKLGQKLRCKVTGFEGIAIVKCEYINGCVQYCLKPPAKDGKMLEGEYVDQQQLEIIDEGISNVITAKETGGIMPDMPKYR